ncbi:tRNA pseudouridine synthase D, partial [Hamiltosporidium magnivora]
NSIFDDSKKEIYEEKETWEEKIEIITDENLDLHTIYDVVIPLKVERGLKGGYRKLIEKTSDLSVSIENNIIYLEFSLSKSAYATMVIREIIGNDILYLE